MCWTALNELGDELGAVSEPFPTTWLDDTARTMHLGLLPTSPCPPQYSLPSHCLSSRARTSAQPLVLSHLALLALAILHRSWSSLYCINSRPSPNASLHCINHAEPFKARTSLPLTASFSMLSSTLPLLSALVASIYTPSAFAHTAPHHSSELARRAVTCPAGSGSLIASFWPAWLSSVQKPSDSMLWTKNDLNYYFGQPAAVFGVDGPGREADLASLQSS